MKTLKGKQLPPQAVILWRVRATLVLVAASFLCGAFFVFSSWFAVIFGVACLVLYAVFVFAYFPLFYTSYSYAFTSNLIIMQKGVIFKRRIRIPTDRVQYCVLIQGPLQKFFHLTSVIVFTAGSYEYVQDLSVKTAEELRNSLMRGVV